MLRRAVPQARFFCEELNEQQELDAEHVFIIDPIDGTMNFVRGYNHSCISVGYLNSGVLSAGAVYDPYVDEMFSAVRGQGAFLNGKAIRVDDSPLSQVVCNFGTAPYDASKTAQTFRLAEELFRAGLDVRRQGSAALDLCSVAAGRAGFYAELSLCLWDYAAGKLIVEEAGGVCLTAEGEPLPFDGRRTTIAAAGKRAMSDYLRDIAPTIC